MSGRFLAPYKELPRYCWYVSNSFKNKLRTKTLGNHAGKYNDFGDPTATVISGISYEIVCTKLSHAKRGDRDID